jgi:flagellar hook-basal body complex protein FliE
LNDSEGLGLNKLTLDNGNLKKGLAYVKNADLQITAPALNETTPLNETHAFKNVMLKYLEDVNTLQHDADSQIQRLVAGETEDLHQVMLAMDEAETSFELMMEIRNKLVSAYQDLMKMQM